MVVLVSVVDEEDVGDQMPQEVTKGLKSNLMKHNPSKL